MNGTLFVWFLDYFLNACLDVYLCLTGGSRHVTVKSCETATPTHDNLTISLHKLHNTHNSEVILYAPDESRGNHPAERIPLFQQLFSVSAYKTFLEVVRFVTSHLDEENAEYTTFVRLPYNWGQQIFEQLDKEDGRVLGRKYRITLNSFQRTLRLSMPSLIHEAAAFWYFHMIDIWFSNGNITLAEKKQITSRTNTTFTLVLPTWVPIILGLRKVINSLGDMDRKKFHVKNKGPPPPAYEASPMEGFLSQNPFPSGNSSKLNSVNAPPRLT